MINTDLTPVQVRKGFAQGITYKASKASGSWEGGQGYVEGRGARVELKEEQAHRAQILVLIFSLE